MASCCCIKKYLDLYVTYTDCKHIVIEDQSKWMIGEGFTKPETIDVLIRLETRGKEVTKEVSLNSRNIFTTIDLFDTTEEQCFLDDIYCFTVENCGLTYSVSRAYLCNTLCKIDQLVAKAKDRIDYENVTFLKRLAESVEINSRLGKIETAREILKDLNKRLDHLTCGHCK